MNLIGNTCHLQLPKVTIEEYVVKLIREARQRKVWVP